MIPDKGFHFHFHLPSFHTSIFRAFYMYFLYTHTYMKYKSKQNQKFFLLRIKYRCVVHGGCVSLFPRHHTCFLLLIHHHPKNHSRNTPHSKYNNTATTTPFTMNNNWSRSVFDVFNRLRTRVVRFLRMGLFLNFRDSLLGVSGLLSLPKAMWWVNDWFSFFNRWELCLNFLFSLM